jgi:hypothetical protein
MTYDEPPAQECANHPGYPAAGPCLRCGQLLCATCLAAHEQDPRRYCPGPAPTERPRTTLAVVLGIVAGVLALCVVALIVAGVMYFRSGTVGAPEIANNLALPPALPGVPPPPPQVTPPAPLPPPNPPIGSQREQAAKTVALQGKRGWVAVINWHQPDWSEVRVWIGPSKNDLRLVRSLSWDPSLRAYVIVDEGPIPKPPSKTTPPPAATGPQPGEQAALDAALANDPGYVATVVKHSADWKQVTVYTGPPLQALANEYRFHWDDGLKQYVLDHMGPIGQGGGTPPGE